MLVTLAIAAALLSTYPELPAEDTRLLARWNHVEKGVRNGTVPEPEARGLLKPLLDELAARYTFKPSPWVFPVEGGRRAWIGGTKGEGFRPRSPRPGYSFYEGNKHGGHPAHDVFIPQDRNRDCKRDKDKREYPAVAMQRAVVLSVNHDWEPGQPRGGKYVWMYAPRQDLLIYYAHLNELTVKPGQILEPGQRLGTVGNTGFPAHKARKPCHIHLMTLKARAGGMTPYDWFKHAPMRRVRVRGTQ